MISPVFIVCSALLVVGAFARPESETVEIESRKAKEVAAQALPVIIGAIGDIIAGKDPVEVTLNRLIQAAEKSGSKHASKAKSALKRIKELADGKTLGEVISNGGTAAIINLAEKVDGGQDLIELLGGKETLKALLENLTGGINGTLKDISDWTSGAMDTVSDFFG